MTAAAQTPSGNASGIALDELDDAVRPQDDLFRHVNGKWIARTDIPSDKARYGSFYLLAEQAEEAVREIIEEAQRCRAGHRGAQGRRPVLELPRREAHREARLGTPRRRARRGRHRRLDRVAAARGSAASSAPASPASSRPSSTTIPGDPEQYRVFLEQGGLGLPDESLLPRGEVRRHPRRLPRVPRAHARAGGAPGCGGARRADRRPRDGARRATTGTTCARATARRPTTR